MKQSEQKQITRAAAHGRGAMLRSLAIIHRAGSSRTQREIDRIIDACNAWGEFTTRNGAVIVKPTERT